MLVGAAVVPGTPLMIPGFGRTDVCADLRGRAIEAVGEVVRQARPDRVVVVGAGEHTRPHDEGAAGSLGGFGLDVRVRLESRPAVPSSPGAVVGPAGQRVEGPLDQAPLPLSLTIGAWLLATARDGHQEGAGARDAPDDSLTVSGLELDPRADLAMLGALGAEQASPDSGRTALVVVADGSAAIAPQSPGMLRPGAADLDARVAAALARGNLDVLRTVTAAAAEDVLFGGWAALQVLAGALDRQAMRTTMIDSDDALGVTYWAAALVAD